MNLEYFSNDKYKILKILYENQITIKEEPYISLSQQEIADIGKYSKLKTNKILNELIKMGYLTVFKNIRGKYAITRDGLKAINSINNSYM